MMLLRASGILMILLQGAMLYLGMGYLPIAACFALLALLGCWPRLQLAWTRRNRSLADAAVAAAFALWWFGHLQGIDQRSDQFGTNVTLAASLALMALQALRYYWRAPHGLDVVFPILGGLSAACAGDTYLATPLLERVFFWLALAHGAVIVLFYATLHYQGSPGKRSYLGYRLAALGMCVLLSIALATGTAVAIGNSDKLLQPWMARAMAPMQRIALGNNPTTRLGNMADFDGSQADQIALQIIAEESPGYLRGQVYAAYAHSTWQAIARGEVVAPWGGDAPAEYHSNTNDENLFPVAPNGDIRRTMTIYPDSQIERAMFTPAATGWVALSSEGVLVNGAQIVEADEELSGRIYQVMTSGAPAPVPLTGDERAVYTQLPAQSADRIRALSAEVCGDRDTTLGKAVAVSQYFTGNYDYALDFRAPPGVDPLEHFLFATPLPDAHCEYFATGATMLLRAAGVPARYVTGVDVWERHPFGDFWIARNRDAHAWCEAWDPKTGWMEVEATPASGLPESAKNETTARLRDLWNMITFNVKRAIQALRVGAWQVAVGALAVLLSGAATFVKVHWIQVLAMACVALLLYVAWRRFRRGRPKKAADPEGLLERRLVAQLSRMDRFISRRHRIARRESQTLHGFARDIEALGAQGNQLAGWYRRWADTRYRPHPDPARVQDLEEEAESLRRG